MLPTLATANVKTELLIGGSAAAGERSEKVLDLTGMELVVGLFTLLARKESQLEEGVEAADRSDLHACWEKGCACVCGLASV